MKTGIIYKVTSPSNKTYIGQTIFSLDARRKRHFWDAFNINSKAYNTKFCKAIRKYKNTLKWKILHDKVDVNDLNKLEIVEVRRHDSYKKGYNSDLGGHVRTRKQRMKSASRKEDHYAAKLNLKLVKHIRELYKTGKHTQNEIVELIGNVVNKAAIGKIIRNERWKDKGVNFKKNMFSGCMERNSHAKLTRKQVAQIRNKYLSRRYTQKQLSIIYNVNEPAIFKILHKITWRNV